MAASPAATASALVSLITTSKPLAAHTCAMPRPIVPAPTTPMRLTSIRPPSRSSPGRGKDGIAHRSAKRDRAARKPGHVTLCEDERRAGVLPSSAGRGA